MSQSERVGVARRWFFLFSLSILGLVALVAAVMVQLRPEPGMRESTAVQAPMVHAQPVRRGPQEIYVTVYGTVKPERSLTLSAPFSGAAHAARELVPGANIQPGEQLFRMLTTSTDLEIDRLGVRLNELDLQEKKLITDRQLLLARMESAKQLYRIAAESFKRQKAAVEIEEQLFSNSEALHERKSLATAEFLAARNRLLGAELAELESQRAMESAQDNLNQLRLTLNNLELQLSTIGETRSSIKLEIAKLNDTVTRADISLDFPAQVEEVYVDTAQEVNSGAALAKLRTVDSVEMTVNIPDAYFRWLYDGDILDEPNKPLEKRRRLDVELVNAEFRKAFSNAYIKSIGESVNSPTRSLPITIGRANPLDATGLPIAREELKPGMYCQISLKLSEIDSVFRIPRSALQVDKRLYHVVRSMADKQPVVAAIDEIEVIHDTGSELIVKLPEEYSDILLVTQPLRSVAPGAQVRIHS